MKPKIFFVIFSILILSLSGCDPAQSPTTPAEISLPKQLTASGKDFVGFWSPDGQSIAFLSARNTDDPFAAAIITELWLIKSDGSEEKPALLVNDLDGGNIAMSRGVNWAKDSQSMLVEIQKFNGSEIWRVSLEAKITKLSSPGESAECPQYSPDGTKIAWLIQESSAAQQSPVYRLNVSNIDFSESIQIDRGLIQDFAWSRNSDALIYSLYDPLHENFEIWKSSVSGHAKFQMTRTNESEIELCYSDDGKYIAYSSLDAVYVTPITPFQSKRVLEHARLPKWLPNRHLLLITRVQTTDSTRFWTDCAVVDLEGRLIRKLAETSSGEINFSPDGAHYIFSRDGNLWIDKL